MMKNLASNYRFGTPESINDQRLEIAEPTGRDLAVEKCIVCSLILLIKTKLYL